MVWLTTVCTEREFDGVYEDCAWASAVMLQNEAYGARVVPQTQAEYEALRAAGGDPVTPGNPGSNVDDVLLGFKNRYGWQPTRLHGWVQIEPVPVGTAVELSGLYANLPLRLRRWSKFRGGHAVTVVKIPGTWWWLDPLAPKDYPGEPITNAELRAFSTGLAGGWGLSVTVGSRSQQEAPELPYQYKAERWLLDGGPGKVTTLGAPLKADGTPDFSRRLALTSGAGGVNPKLTELARTRLTVPTDDLTDEFFTALASYTLPTTDGTASFNAGVEAASQEALTAKK